MLLAEVARLEREFPMQKIEAVQFEDLFTQRLTERYDADRSAVSDERTEQDALAQRLQDANAAFTSARANTNDPTSRAREQALQRLEGAYRRFHEILSNLDAARKFYNDLARMVTRYRDACRDFRYQRHLEANQFESYVDPFRRTQVPRARSYHVVLTTTGHAATSPTPCPPSPSRRRTPARTGRRSRRCAPSIAPSRTARPRRRNRSRRSSPPRPSHAARRCRHRSRPGRPSRPWLPSNTSRHRNRRRSCSISSSSRNRSGRRRGR